MRPFVLRVRMLGTRTAWSLGLSKCVSMASFLSHCYSSIDIQSKGQRANPESIAAEEMRRFCSFTGWVLLLLPGWGSSLMHSSSRQCVDFVNATWGRSVSYSMNQWTLQPQEAWAKTPTQCSPSALRTVGLGFPNISSIARASDILWNDSYHPSETESWWSQDMGDSPRDLALLPLWLMKSYYLITVIPFWEICPLGNSKMVTCCLQRLTSFCLDIIPSEYQSLPTGPKKYFTASPRDWLALYQYWEGPMRLCVTKSNLNNHPGPVLKPATPGSFPERTPSGRCLFDKAVDRVLVSLTNLLTKAVLEQPMSHRGQDNNC